MQATRQKMWTTVLAWFIALLVFFPISWMAVTAFKTEVDAIATPPSLFFTPTTENFQEVFDRSNYGRYVWNSIAVSFGSTILALIFAIPA
ncbi:MAG: carbohydrate ABC transporter permease, partial [Chromatiales bacterium]|nr:carbohydrate ABC transporter permease [Chromatiales bacterium]